MHGAGESDSIAGLLGVVELTPAGHMTIERDGLLVIGALMLRDGRVFILPRLGVTHEHFRSLRTEAEHAVLNGPGPDWNHRDGVWITGVRAHSSGGSAARAACSSSAGSGPSLARRFQARS